VGAGRPHYRRTRVFVDVTCLPLVERASSGNWGWTLGIQGRTISGRTTWRENRLLGKPTLGRSGYWEKRPGRTDFGENQMLTTNSKPTKTDSANWGWLHLYEWGQNRDRGAGGAQGGPRVAEQAKDDGGDRDQFEGPGGSGSGSRGGRVRARSWVGVR
jgi:hypothetical protein